MMNLYTVKRIKKYSVLDLYKVLSILRKCGKNMKEQYGLEHWYNPWIKDVVIVLLCALKNDIFLVANSDRKSIATYQLKFQGTNCNLCKLATSPDFSGNGVGSFCIKAIEQQASKNNCKNVIFEVYEKSHHAIHFYENRGYKVIGSKDTRNYRELIMKKEL